MCAPGMVFLALALPARSQVVEWSNAAGGAWTDAADWSPMNVPTSLETASITLAGKYSVALSSSETIESLFLDSSRMTLAFSAGTLGLSKGSLGSSTIAAGTVAMSGGARITTTSGMGTYSLTNEGTIQSTAGSNLIEGTGGAGTGMAFTNGGSIIVSGGTLTLGSGAGDTVTNQSGGTIAVNGAAGTLILDGGTASILNSGMIRVTDGGTIDFDGNFTTGGLGGTISVGNGGGALNIGGTLDNQSATLIGPLGGVYTLDGGTINLGTVAGGALTFSSGAGTLNGVTMSGDFTVPAGAGFSASDGTTFTGGTTTFGANSFVHLTSGSANALTIASGDTWTGGIAIAGQVANLGLTNNGTIVNAMGANKIYGGGFSGFTFANNGTVESTGGTLTIADGGTDVFTDAPGATVEASGGNITMGIGTATVSNLSGNTLAEGVWIVSGGGTMTFASATNSVVTNGAATTLELSGTGSTITSGPSNRTLEQTLTTNDGTLEVLSSRNFASTSSGLTNNGALQLGGGTLTAASLTNGPGSSLSGIGTLNPSGGVTIGPGVTVSPGTAAANQFVGTLSFGGAGNLGPGGAYTFDIMNSISPVAGTDNDTIDVAGTLTVGATPVTPFTISLESINPGTGLPGPANFSSAGTYQWTLLSASSISGFNASDFMVNTSSFANGLGNGTFYVSASSTDIFLNFTSVPEPSSWALIGAGVAAMGIVSLRRRRPRA